MFAELPAYAQYYQAERPGLWLHKIDGSDKLERKWRLRRQQRGYHEGAEAEADADVAPETTGDDEADVGRRQSQAARAQPVYNYYRTHTQPTYQFVLPAVPAQSPPYHYYYSPAAAASRNRANATPKYNKGLKSKLSNDSDYCWEFLQKGWCPRGDQCTWKHGTDTICRFFPDCTNANCRFVHPDAASTGSAAAAVGTAGDVGLEADKPDAEDVNLDLDEETRAYQARLVSLKATIEREEQKVRAKLERAGTLQDTFKRIDADKKMLTEKLERTEREIVLERERYETCKARLQEIAQNVAQEVKPLQSQLDDQAQAKSGLREQVEELKQQLSRKQEELATMDRECGALQEDITAVRSRYQSQTDEVVDERNRYEQRTEQLFAQRKKCEHTLNALTTDMVNVQNEEREFEEELEHEATATETDRESIAQSTKRAPIESDWCWDFMQKGWCQRGASCQWKHGEQPAVATETQTPVAAVAAVAADTETVATPTPTATGTETEAAVDKKDPVCWEFSLFGTCPRGANCHWQHVSASASSLPSKESEIKKLCVEEEEEEETVEVEETSQVTEGVKAETPTKQEESPPPAQEEEDEDADSDSDFGDAALVD